MTAIADVVAQVARLTEQAVLLPVAAGGENPEDGATDAAKEAAQSLDRAKACLAKGDITEVIRACERVLSHDAKNDLALLFGAIAGFKRGDLAAAERLFTLYVSDAPDALPFAADVRAILASLKAAKRPAPSTAPPSTAPPRAARPAPTSPAPKETSGPAAAPSGKVMWRVVRVRHVDREPGATYSVNWVITQHCNFTCSYCTAYDNSASYPSLDELKSAADKIGRLQKPKLLLTLTGGEPTLHPGYTQFVKYLADTLPGLANLRTDSNLSRKPRFYRELADAMGERIGLLTFHVSYHFEFTDMDALLANARFLAGRGAEIQIRLLAHPERMDEVRRFSEMLGSMQGGRLSFIVKTIRKHFGAFPDDRYTAEDLAWLAEVHDMEEIERKIAVDFAVHRDGKTTIERRLFNANEMIARGLNGFKGMGCYAGAEMLAIDAKGNLDSAVCFRRLRTERPNIYRDPEISAQMLRKLVCPYPACGCPDDIALTKVTLPPDAARVKVPSGEGAG